MTPVQFVVHEGDSAPNTPVYKIAAAMTKDILVYGADGGYEIESYYYCEKRARMVLDISKRERP